MTFSERLAVLIKENKTTQKAVAEYVGVRYASISDWKKDGSYPRADIAIKIAQVLGTTVEYLITGKDKEGFSQIERALVADYRSLSSKEQNSVQTLIKSMLPATVAGKKAG